MTHYLVQLAYTPEAWAAMVNRPHDRSEVIQPMIERAGGSIIGMWFCFGDYDVVGVFQMPDNTSAKAIEFVVLASGAIKTARVTPLMSMGEGLQALKRACDIRYQPPTA